MGAVAGTGEESATQVIGANRYAALLVCLLILLGTLLPGCRSPELHRPDGVMRVGKVTDFVGHPETFLPHLRVLVRFDDRGLSVMSTACTYDLSPLELVEEEGGRILFSRFSGSRYTISGAVISGPQVAPLPFFPARVASETWDGPSDTLYVEVGRLKEVDSHWRLPIRLKKEG